MKWLLIRLVLLTALACALGAGFAHKYHLRWVPTQPELDAEGTHARAKAEVHEPNNAERIEREALIPLARFLELARAGALVIDARKEEADFTAAHLDAPFVVHMRSEDAPQQAGALFPLAQADVPILLYCQSRSCDESEIAYLRLRAAFPQVGRFFIYQDGWEGLKQASVLTKPGAPPDLPATADACLNHVIETGPPAEFTPQTGDPRPPGAAATAPSDTAPPKGAGQTSASDTPVTMRDIAALGVPWLAAAAALVLLIAGQRRAVAWGGRLVVGGLFLLAAGLKIRDPMQFASDIRSYLVFPPLATNTMALLIPWLEATAAGALIVGLWRREARVIVAVLLVAFTGLKAAVLASGRTIDCGCYGANNVLATMEVGWRGVGFNGALLVILAAEALASWRLGRKVAAPAADDADTRSASVPHP